MTTKTLGLALCFAAMSAACSQSTMNNNHDLGTTVSQDMTVPVQPADMTIVALSEQAQQGLLISPFPVSVANMSLAQIEQVGIGSYIVNSVGGCTDCHGSAPNYLGGGTPFALGGTNVVYSRNLTSDPNNGLRLTHDQFVAVMRTGQDFKQQPSMNGQLLVMPWPAFRWMSQDDIDAVYAYLQLVPPITTAVMADTKPAAMPIPFPSAYNEGDITRPLPADPNPQDPLNYQRGLAIQPLADPPSLATASQDVKNAFGRGSYLVAIGGCNDCHTNPARDMNPASATFLKINTAAYLAGGMVFAVPPPLAPVLKEVRTMSADLTGMTNGSIGANITSTLFPYVLSQFKHLEDPGTPPLGFPMSPNVGKLVYSDLNALYTYLSMVPRRTGAGDKATQDYARYCMTATDCNMAAGETCNATTKECVGRTCAVDSDCNTCQTCSGGATPVCVAPMTGAACLTGGI